MAEREVNSKIMAAGEVNSKIIAESNG